MVVRTPEGPHEDLRGGREDLEGSREDLGRCSRGLGGFSRGPSEVLVRSSEGGREDFGRFSRGVSEVLASTSEGSREHLGRFSRGVGGLLGRTFGGSLPGAIGKGVGGIRFWWRGGNRVLSGSWRDDGRAAGASGLLGASLRLALGVSLPEVFGARFRRGRFRRGPVGAAPRGASGTPWGSFGSGRFRRRGWRA